MGKQFIISSTKKVVQRKWGSSLTWLTRSNLQLLSIRDLNLSKYFIAKKLQLLTKSACRIQHDHDRPDPPQASKFMALPKIISIDWFEPEYWNKLMVGEHAEYMACGIQVVLLLPEHCQTWDQCHE